MKKKYGPWIIQKSAQKYKNPWIEVREDHVSGPCGERSVFGVVNMKEGVSVLPMDEAEDVYLTEEFHYAIGRNSIETVSGGIDGDEMPLEAAKRELLEELGITASEWTPLGVLNPFTTVIQSPSHLFLARKLEFSEPHPETNEKIRTYKTGFQKALKMVMESEITHGPSCVLILKVGELVRQSSG
jgi:ADP-ribose pyrophosphatase